MPLHPVISSAETFYKIAMEVGAVLKRETGVQVNKMLIIPSCRLICLHYVNFLPQNVMNCTLQRIILSNLKQSNLKQ